MMHVNALSSERNQHSQPCLRSVENVHMLKQH